MAPRNRSLSRAAALGMTAAAVALLTGCSPSTGTTHSSPPNTAETASSSPQRPKQPTNSPASNGSGGSGSSAASPRPTTANAPARTDACRSLPVSATVKADVTAAYGKQAEPRLTHITPVKGTFYYGSCDGSFYAGTRFQLTPGSTEAEQVALQDDGSVMKYFIDRPGTGWTYLASDPFPASPKGCAAIPEIPAHLSALWNDCRS
ncbi:hypothetical protein EV578_106460 [Streptomyces sp. BK205]|nr:hypothetical protein EV578_106460 [Streptomyces sp. BK205]